MRSLTFEGSEIAEIHPDRCNVHRGFGSSSSATSPKHISSLHVHVFPVQGDVYMVPGAETDIEPDQTLHYQDPTLQVSEMVAFGDLKVVGGDL